MIPAAPRAAPRAELIRSMIRPAELIDAFRRMFPSPHRVWTRRS